MSINITLIIQGLAFFAVALLVMKFGWPGIMGAIEARQKKIADGLAAADAGTRALSDARAKEEALIKEARVKANEILERAHQQANKVVDEAKELAIAERNRQIAVAEAEVANLAHHAKAELRGKLAGLAVKGAEQLIRKEINPATHQQLIDQLIAEV